MFFKVLVADIHHGIGGRGPGETKLEIDKRRINDRIAFLNDKLKKAEQARDIQRARREKNSIPVVSPSLLFARLAKISSIS